MPSRKNCSASFRLSHTFVSPYQTTVTEFLKNKNGELCQVKTVKLEPQKDEKTGRMMMVPVKGTEGVMPADIVLIAAGFLGRAGKAF